MKKLFFLILFLGVFVAQVPPPLTPPLVYFYNSSNPPDPDNLAEGSVESFNKISPSYYGFLVLDCPSNPEDPCIFNFSEISLSEFPNLDSSSKLVFCNQRFRQNLCYVVVEADSRKIIPFAYLSDPYDNFTKIISPFSDEIYLIYRLNITKGTASQYFPLVVKKYKFEHYPPNISLIENNISFCRTKINLRDDDELSTKTINLPFEIQINNGSYCRGVVVINGNTTYRSDNSSCDPELFSLLFRGNGSSDRNTDKKVGLDLNLTVTLNSSYSPFRINWSNGDLSYNFSCQRGYQLLRIYDLSYDIKISRERGIFFEANASNPRSMSPTNFSTGFYLMGELEVIDSNDRKTTFLYKWNCTSENCTSGLFTPNPQYPLISNSDYFSPNFVNVSLLLNISSICPNGDKDKLIFTLKAGSELLDSSVIFENKTIKIYDGPCIGPIKFSADIYKSSKKEGRALSFMVPNSKIKENEYIIIKIKNLENSPKAVIEVRATLFNGETVDFTNFIVPDRFPYYIFLDTYYDIKQLSVLVYPFADSKKGVYKSFEFALERPILAIDKVLVGGQQLDSEKQKDLEKNSRLFLDDNKNIDITFVFLNPQDIRDYDFDSYIVPITSGGGCEGKLVEKTKDYLKLVVKFKEKGCLLKVRGKVLDSVSHKTFTFSDFLIIKLYSKDVFVPQTPQSFCSEKEVITSQYYKFFLVGIASIVFVIAIAFMIGNLFSNPRLLEWSKREITEVILLGVFLVLVGQLLVLNCEKYVNISSISNLFGLEPLKTVHMDTSIAEFAQNTLYYLSERIHSTIIILRRDIAYFHISGSAYTYSGENIVVEIIRKSAQMTFGQNENPHSFSYNYMAVFNFLLNLNNFYLFNVLTHYFLLFFLSSSSGLIIFLLPVGLFFRCMPFLKNVGAAMIAIGIGFYILFPFGYALYGLLLENTQTKLAIHCLVFNSDDVCKDSSTINIIKTDFFITNKFSYLADLVEVGSFTKDTFPNSDAIFKYGEDKKTLQPIFPKSKESFSPNLNIYIGLSAINFILAFFIPSIILLAVLSFVRDLASILGGDIDVSKLAYLA
ncbi:MAG: hypothetical protein QXV64_00640 [Candidatus Anstonellaceae archaeon]